MEIHLHADVPDVDPDAAARWWNDFQDGRHDHAFVPGTRRTIVSRTDGEVTMREETRILGLRVFRETTTARPGPRDVQFEGENDLATFTGRYSFAPHAGGTRIVLDADVTLRQGLRWTTFAAKPIVDAILRLDLAGHAKEMRRDIATR